MPTPRKGRKRRSLSSKPIIEALEPRILLSADLPGFDVPDLQPHDPTDVDVGQVLAQAHKTFQAAATERARDVDDDDPVEDPGLPAAAGTGTPVRQELIIVDPGVPGYDTLLADVQATGSDGVNLTVFMLDPERDGILQISELLSQYSGLDAVHLITHGSPGSIQLGSDVLDLDTLQRQEHALIGWSAALSDTADMLIYGCDLAANVEGRLLVDMLAGLTGADVAASDDLTGHVDLGGDWELEYRFGQIETDLALSEPVWTSWSHTLVAGNGAAVWSDTSNTPQTGEWDGTGFGTAGDTATLADRYRMMQGADAPTRNEKIVVGVDGSQNVTGEMWNGTSWSALPLNNLGTVSESFWYGAEVAYEQVSGDAVLVWNDSSQASGDKLRYAVWDGSSWTAPQSIGAYAGTEPQNLRLAFDPGSDAMVLVVSDTGADHYALVWDGDNWGNAVLLDSSGTAESDQSAIAVSFGAQSGNALVTYGKNGDTDVYYREWNGTTWEPEASLAATAGIGTQTAWMSSANDPNSDRIVLGVSTTGNEAWAAIWNGSGWEAAHTLVDGTAATTTGSIYPNLAVAFEHATGEALVTYGKNGQTNVYYQAWIAGSGWSGEATGPGIGGESNSMTLDSDPSGSGIMLSVQDANNDLHYVHWSGSAWGVDNELSSNTGEAKNQPFVFIYDQDGFLGQPVLSSDLVASQDTFIQLGSPGLNYGVSTSLVVDREDTDLQRALLQFDLGALAGNVLVTGATLQMQASAIDGDLNIDVYEMLGAWSEGAADGGTDAANWTQRSSGTNWTSAGGDYNATPVASLFTNSTGQHSWDLTALVQAWVSGAKVNSGVMVASTDGGGNRTVTYDSAEGTIAPELRITYQLLNDAPVNTVPSTQTTAVDSPAVFSTGNGNAISVSDSDDGSLQVALSSTNGTLTLASVTGLSFTTGDGTADPNMVISGTVADINLALDGLQFDPTAAFEGYAGLQISSTDFGGSGGGPESDVDAVGIEVGDVNNVPLNTLPGAQTFDQDGMLLFSSATGTAISISDPDAGSNEVEVTLTATNGTMNLSGTKGLTFTPPADGVADATMTFTGTVADINAALEGATFVATPGFTGTADVQVMTNDLGNTGAGGPQTDTDSITITVAAADQKIWMTFENDESSTGNTEIPSVSGGDVVTFDHITQLETSNSDPLASITSGSFAYGFDLDTVLLTGGGQASDGNTRVDAVHYVASDIQVGSNNLQLRAGDLLLSTEVDESIDGITYRKEDVFFFRPDTAGDYSQGSFFRLINGKDGSPTGTGWGNVTGITLVGQTTMVGGVTLNAGDFLVAHSGSDKNILHFTPGTLGATTTGTTSILIDKDGINNGQSIGGLHLVQADIEIAGRTLSAGQILLSLSGNGSGFADNAIDVDRRDIVVLNVTSTGVGASAATAERFFEGLDESLDNDNETIWGIGYQGNSAPIASADAFALDENSPNGTTVGSVTAADLELGALRYAITAGNTDGAFTIDANTGQITVANSAALDFETTPGFTLTVAAIDPEGAYDTATITINLNDLVENTPPTVSLSNVVTTLSEAADTSTAIKIADIVISDDGFGSNGLSVNGVDAAMFEIVGTELFLKTGAALDFETNPSLDVTVQVDDTGVGGTPDDSAAVSLSITDANDAPVLDNSGTVTLTPIFENQTNSTGTLVSDLVAGLITDQDMDADGIAIRSVDDSNGTWQYSTDGGSNWSAVGAVTDNSALLLTSTANDLVRFVPNVAFNGTVSFDFRAWDGTNGSNGATADASSIGGSTAFSSAAETATINVTPIDIKLFFSTVDDQVSSGTPAVDSWSRGDVIAIGDPGFALEADGAKDDNAETSGGTLYDLTQGFLNAANTASSDTVGDVRLSAMHYVGQDVTVGSGSTFNLSSGDLLLSVAHDSATFDGSEAGDLTVGKGDVFVYRPDLARDYSAGSFYLLLKDPAGGGNLTGIALTETVVTMGSTTLASGTLVFASDAVTNNNVYFYRPDQVGATTTALSSGTLIDGDTIGLGVSGATGNPITGLSLIKQSIVVDGVSLSEGSLLVALDKNDGVVGNSGATTAGQKNDIYALDVSATEVDGGSVAEATLLFDGSDIGLNTNGEGFSAFTVLIDTSGGTQDPSLVLDGGSPGFTEDGAATLISPGTTVNDPDSADLAGGQLRVEITANGTVNDRLSVQDQGAVTLVGDLVQYSSTTVGTLTGGTSGLPLVITFNSIASDSIVQDVARSVSYSNISGDPSELTRTVQFQVTDGDGGTSAQRTKDITVTAVNDNPTITSAATASVVENTTAVMMVTATDPEFDTPTFYVTGGDDAAFFDIDSVTGALSFRDAPDFEGAADADANNSYRVEVTARDGDGNEDSLLITVSVTDVNEGPVAADWYNADWGQRKAVTIDNTKVSGSLTDFPVLVSIAVGADLAAGAQLDGDDILFTAADGTSKLAHEIEYYNSATGELRVWVKTDVSAGQNTVLYLYYGNATVGSQQDAANVWDGNFVGVWHLDEAPDSNAGVDEVLDSTVYGHDGNTEGAIDATDLVTARIGEGIDFDSVDASLIRIADSAVLDTTAAHGTFELWINFDNAADGDHQIIMTSSNRYTGGANDGYEWASQGDGDHFFYPWGGDGSNNNLGPNPFTNGQWHHLAVTYDYDQRDANIFVDGAEMTYADQSVGTYWDTLANPADWLWGGNPDRGTRYFDGLMDEIRVSNTDRSLAWIQTSYANQDNAGAFASIGVEQSRTLSVSEDDLNDTSVGFAYGFDDDGDALTYAITGGNTDNAFKINAATGEIQVNDASKIDFETLNSYTLTVSVTDPEGEVDSATVSIAVTDVNEAPTVSLVNPANTIAENTDTSAPIRIADIVIDDDALGTNTLSLAGADAGSFEIVGNELRLKAGTTLDYETQVNYDVSVQVDDAGVGGTPDDTAPHPFEVANVNEAPAFSNSGDTVAFTEGGAPVVLDADHTIFDPELSALDNFAGATLTLVRNGGANADDAFTATGTLGALTEGGNLVVGATTIGAVTTNSAGTLVLTLNANATNSLVNQAMQQIAFSNSNDTPPPAVQIDWIFDDGNSGAQGSGGAATGSASTSVSIIGTNDAPVITSDGGAATAAVNAAENQTAVTTVTASDVDAGDTPTFSISGGADSGLFSITAGGVLTFNSARDFETYSDANSDGVYEVQVTADDGNGGTDVQLISVTVTNVNEAPTDIAPNSFSVNENTDTSGGYSVGSLSSSDVDAGDTSTYTIVGGADQGRFAIGGAGSDELILTDGTLNFENQSSYQVMVRTTDAGGLWYEETLTVSVNDLNEAPSGAGSLTTTTLNDNAGATALFGGLSVIDPDAGETDLVLRITLSNPSAGTLSGGGFSETAPGSGVYTASGLTTAQADAALDAVTFTPTDNTGGSGSFTTDMSVDVDDGGAGYQPVLAATTVTIDRVNDDPTITSGAAVNAAENQTAVTTVTASDVDAGDTPTFSISGGADSGLFSITAGGVLTFNSARDFETYSDANSDGVYEVQVTADDGNGGTDVQLISVTVTNVNEAPTDIAPNSFSVNENTDTSGGYSVGSLSSSDVDAGDTSTYTIVGGADQGRFAIGGAGSDELILTDGTLNFENQSSYQVMVRTTDAGGLWYEETLTVSVNDLNEAPSGAGSLTTTTLNDNAGATALFGGLSVIDPDAGETDLVLRITLSNPSAGTLSGGGFSETAPGSGVYTASGLTTAQADAALDAVTFTPTDNTGGSGSFTTDMSVDVDDGGAGYQPVLAATTVTIDRVNDDPTITSGAAVNAAENQTAVTTVTASDVDAGDTPTFSISGGADSGLFSITAGGVLTFNSARDFETYSDANSDGVYEVQVTADDGNGGTDVQLISVTVTNVNETPTTSPVTLAPIAEDSGGRTITQAELLANSGDVDGDGLTATGLAISAGNGSLSDNGDGTWDYTPAADDDTSVGFGYTVTDGALSVAGSASLDITPVADAPVIAGVDSGSVTEDLDPDLDTLLEASGALSVTDADAGESSFIAETVVGSHGQLAIDATGNWTYRADNTRLAVQSLDAGQAVNDVLAVRTADGTLHNVSVTVNGAEDAPVVAGQTSGTVVEDGVATATGTLSISDIDTADNPVSFPDQPGTPGDNGYGMFELTAGSWTYSLDNSHSAVQALDAGASLSDSRTFTATDGTTQVVTIVISGAAEPVAPPVVEPPVPPPVDPPTDPGPVDPPADPDPEPEPEPEPEESGDKGPEDESEDEDPSFSPAPPGILQPLQPDEILLSVLAEYRSTDTGDLTIPGPADKPGPAAAQTFLQELRAIWQPEDAAKPLELMDIRSNQAFMADLQSMSDNMGRSMETEKAQMQLNAEAAAGVSISLTAGFVSWALRAGSMMASLLAAMPTWRHFDPMPILAADDKASRKPLAQSDDGPDDPVDAEEAADARVEDMFD